MAKLGRNQIRDLAKQVITQHPDGIRYGELLRTIVTEHPETPRNTVQGSIWNLAEIFPSEITKPSRGLFKSATAAKRSGGTLGGGGRDRQPAARSGIRILRILLRLAEK